MIERLSYSLQIAPKYIKNVLDLLENGATIPFIARYRKDKTGGLDEVKIEAIRDRFKDLTHLEDRRTFILTSLAEKGIQNQDIIGRIKQSDNIQILEDLYAPFKSRKKTRADIARERGLEPLARLILSQRYFTIITEASKYIKKDVPDVESALQGARDIICEIISDDVALKESLRMTFQNKGIISTKVIKNKVEEAVKYKDYFAFSEQVKKIAGHRFLAINRGSEEGYLRLSIEPSLDDAIFKIERKYIKNNSEASEHVKLAIQDSYKRLIKPVLENEFLNKLKTNADKEAIEVFAKNLKQLLLASPLGNKKILAIDPGYRTGCKLAMIDADGSLLETAVIYVHDSSKLKSSHETISALLTKYGFEVIAIGNGTASKETEKFFREMQLDLPIFMVNEDGASVYSASEAARQEFPDLDLTFRSAVSIGRRLMDPLAELIKIDPKSIGIGQYQHDVNQVKLKEKLDQTVESCVNAVGVNLNTADHTLLSYVSGIGPALAQNIVDYRRKTGVYKSRDELLKVPRLGAKAYQQAAGFLRIKDGTNVLDKSGVHPESYKIVYRMAKDLGIMTEQLIGNPILDGLDTRPYQDEENGELTLMDIISELKKPGLDPRKEATEFNFAPIESIDELYEGMIIPGKVTNLTNFGAFIDIGIKEGGMVHISEIANKYIKDPAEVLSLDQGVMVRIIGIDKDRKRISLSIKQVS
ncbi:MAG: RNA-binding transcriptional accessory protein [Saprospiraceae bacterium]|nr:RNA-binding transcriptional accessory protein [Saprospiraceae bacterium]